MMGNVAGRARPFLVRFCVNTRGIRGVFVSGVPAHLSRAQFRSSISSELSYAIRHVKRRVCKRRSSAQLADGQ
jgi:hypothetical protein